MAEKNIKKLSIELVAEVYNLVKKLPAEEETLLASLLKNAAIEVSTNIAKSEAALSEEGQREFLSTAKGKIAVVETLILLCVELKYLGEAEVQSALNSYSELGRILNSL